MKAKRGLRRLLSLAVMLCMVLTMSLSAFATAPQAGNDAVQADKQGVLQVRVGFKVKDTNDVLEIKTGTGFLINSDYLITCNHVVSFDDLSKKDWESINENLGMTRKQVEDKRVINVSVYRDVKVAAKIVTTSAVTDLAVLQLEKPIQNKTHLMINDSPVQTTAPCYTLGFPALIDVVGDINTYTSDDVTVTGGIINKIQQVNTVSFIAYSDNMTSGGSGGPVVNYAGQVIGIFDGTLSGDGFDKDFRYAVDVKELRAMLDPLGIEYTLGSETDMTGTPIDNRITDVAGGNGGGAGDGGQEEGPEGGTTEATVNKDQLKGALDSAASADTSKYEKSYVDSFNKAKEDAQKVFDDAAADQGQVDNAKDNLVKAQSDMQAHEKKPGLPLPAIIAIIAAIIILLVVLLILKPGKKAEEPVYNAPDPYAGGGFAAGPGPAAGGYGGAPMGGGYDYGGKPESGTTVLGGGAGDTTVLGGDSNSTTVLSGGANYGSLTRTKNGERVTISKDQFKIGRERSRVDFCISDNTAVGRLHAIIVSRGGSTYVVDQNSTNCTFVNNVRATANQEVRLNNGDKVTFADEEFTYNAF